MDSGRTVVERLKASLEYASAHNPMRDDTAFMDCILAYVPGWDFPKLNPNEHFTDHFGLVSDFLSECWSRLAQEAGFRCFRVA